MLEQKLGYKFNEPHLLKLALTHRSHGKVNNERLEFLGDTMLSSVISSYLYDHHNNFSEGVLSQARAHLVNRYQLAKIANDFGLSEYLILGGSELHNDQSKHEAIAADAVEAIVGAIYLDSGWQKLKDTIIPWFDRYLRQIASEGIKRHPKSALQEWTQAKAFPLPKYTTITQKGPSHSAIFIVECSINGVKHITTGKGTSKQAAEELSAKEFLAWLEQNNHE